MTIRTKLLAAASIGVIAGSSAAAMGRDAEHPAVVELYQSQGCSSCPPAIANINALAGRKDILALTFAVTYWDQLGWKDTFAKPEFTKRQWDYARANQRANVATPQTIVNGRGFANGGNLQQLVATIRSAERGNSGPQIKIAPGKILVGAAESKRRASVWLVRYDPRAIRVPIRAGENGGRTLVHRNVVRSLESLGTWRGTKVTFAFPRASNPDLRAALLIQEANGGRIIAALKI